MLGSNQRPIRSNPATQFTEALAQDVGSANYDLALPQYGAAVFINGFTICSVENLSWELWVLSTAAGLSATSPIGDQVIGLWQFPVLFAQGVGYAPTTF